jgi:hypothetical protein
MPAIARRGRAVLATGLLPADAFGAEGLQITSPQIGRATVTFEALPVDDLGTARHCCGTRPR